MSFSRGDQGGGRAPGMSRVSLLGALCCDCCQAAKSIMQDIALHKKHLVGETPALQRTDRSPSLNL